jgi:hypothetical protein
MRAVYPGAPWSTHPTAASNLSVRLPPRSVRHSLKANRRDTCLPYKKRPMIHANLIETVRNSCAAPVSADVGRRFRTALLTSAPGCRGAKTACVPLAGSGRPTNSPAALPGPPRAGKRAGSIRTMRLPLAVVPGTGLEPEKVPPRTVAAPGRVQAAGTARAPRVTTGPPRGGRAVPRPLMQVATRSGAGWTGPEPATPLRATTDF